MLTYFHIVGAVLTVLAFGFGVLALGVWEQKRIVKAAVEEMSIALGIPVDRLDDAENDARFFQFAASRFSSERFQNRLSDFCWWVRAAWGWLGTLLQGGILIAVVWYSFTGGPSNAIHAWWMLAVAVLFWVVSVAFSYTCKLITGRYPGQARQARKELAELLKKDPGIASRTGREDVT